ncbi:hypothetical protein AHAS_Ahas18G0210500 [Arachis hypogaea]
MRTTTPSGDGTRVSPPHQHSQSTPLGDSLFSDHHSRLLVRDHSPLFLAFVLSSSRSSTIHHRGSVAVRTASRSFVLGFSPRCRHPFSLHRLHQFLLPCRHLFSSPFRPPFSPPYRPPFPPVRHLPFSIWLTGFAWSVVQRFASLFVPLYLRVDSAAQPLLPPPHPSIMTAASDSTATQVDSLEN